MKNILENNNAILKDGIIYIVNEDESEVIASESKLLEILYSEGIMVEAYTIRGKAKLLIKKDYNTLHESDDYQSNDEALKIGISIAFKMIGINLKEI